MSVIVWDFNSGATFPLFITTGAGATGEIATGAATIPLFTASGVLQTWDGAVTLPLFGVASTGVTGVVGDGDTVFSIFSASGIMTKESAGAVTFPLFTTAGVMQLDSPWVGDVTFPAFQALGIFVTGDGISADPYEVWVVNRETGAHSTYTAWPANSHGVFNGTEIIATPTGLFTLGGLDDDGTGIIIKAYWPPSEFGTSKQKRLEQPIVDRRLGGDFNFVSITDETEKRVYELDLTGWPEGIHPKRVPTTRKLQGRKWQFGIESTDGGGLALNDVEVETIVLSRKLK